MDLYAHLHFFIQSDGIEVAFFQHPFHLHGVGLSQKLTTVVSDCMRLQHSFDVVKSADSDTYNFNDPVRLMSTLFFMCMLLISKSQARRDTTPVAENNLTTIRFRTDNPGPWFLHWCVYPHLMIYTLF